MPMSTTELPALPVRNYIYNYGWTNKSMSDNLPDERIHIAKLREGTTITVDKLAPNI